MATAALAVLVSICLLVSLSACGGEKRTDEDEIRGDGNTSAENTEKVADESTETSQSEPEYADITVDGISLSEYKIYSSGAPGIFSDRVMAAVTDCTGRTPLGTAEPTGNRIELVIDPALEENSYRLKSGDGVIRLESDTETGLYECLCAFEQTLASKKLVGETAEVSFSSSGAYITPFEKVSELESAHFYCETDKSALSYEIGEEMNIKVCLSAGGELASCPVFKWTMKGDDGKSSEGTESGINGSISLKTTLDTNGFVMITVKALDASGNEINSAVSFSGAVGVHPELVTQTHEEPSDFDDFWSAAISEMNSVEPEIVDMVKVNNGYNGFEVYKMKIACVGNEKWTGDTYVSGFLSFPKNASEGTLKIKATFQGYGVSSPSVSCSDGYITFAVCGHSMEIDEDSRYYTELKNGSLNGHGWYATDNSDPSGAYFKYMLLRDLQALRFMKQYFGEDGNGLWDGETITLSGGSQGGFQVIALAALDEDVTSINASVPWLCDIGGYIDGKKIQSSFQPEYCDGIKYFDTVNFAKRVKCPVSITAGLGDPLCPPAGVAAMYNALSCPKTLTFKQGGTHSYTQPGGELFEFSDAK